MKKIKYVLVTLLSTLLVGCDFNFSLSLPIFSSQNTSSIDTSENGTSFDITTEESSSFDITTEESSFDITTENNTTSSEFVSSEIFTTEESSSSISLPPKPDGEYGDRTVNIFSINDFHGATEVNKASYEEGILKVGTFLKQKGKEENTLLINAGDMWQGSIYSNYNRGAMLTDIMNDIEFDAFSIGNHEFDWGANYISQNKLRKGPNGNDQNGYQTPFLGANMYKYNIVTKTVGEFASELADKYAIRDLENGLRVGIIGIIGTQQITSICSQYADDYTFIDPISVTKDLSDELRNKYECDVIILSAHTDPGDVLGVDTDGVYSGTLSDNNGLTKYSAVSGKRYVDAVICAHTHQRQQFTSNGVPLVQAQSNGKSYGEVSLKVTSEGNVSILTNKYVYTSNINISNIDQSINNIYTKYKLEADKVGNVVLGTLDSTLDSYDDPNVGNLVTAAMADCAISSGFDIDYAVTNNGRDDLTSGNITYAKLFKSLPFDNIVYIAKVTGYNLKYRLEKGYYFYRNDTSAISNSSTKYYTVAIIDYLLLHRNESRDYNYFTDIEIIGQLTKTGQDIYNYRDVTADYIRKLSTIKASDYSSSNIRHNVSKITSAVSF